MKSLSLLVLFWVSACSRPALLALWGNGPSDVWAVGESATVLRWNGSVWSKGASPVPAYPNYAKCQAIWGSGSNDVWIVGKQGAVHWNGSTWTSAMATAQAGQPSASLINLTGVWGNASGQIWFTGNGESSLVMQNRPDSGFLEVGGENQPGYTAIWGNGQDAWAAGWSQSGNHTDGYVNPVTAAVSGPPALDTTATFTAIFGSSTNNVWAVGGNVTYRFDGASWQQSPTPASTDFYASLSAVWSSGPTDVWVVGYNNNGGIILHFDGQSWVSTPPAQIPASAALNAVWGSGPADVWVAGNNATLMHFDGASWQKIDTSDLVDSHVSNIVPIAG